MDKEQFQRLAEKISSGVATEKEVARYNYYYNFFQEESVWDENLLGSKEEIEEALHSRIIEKLPSYPTKVKRFPYLKIAAAIAVIVSSILFLSKYEPNKPAPVYTKQNIPVQQDVDPGTDKAVLTLSDGTIIQLDEIENGVVANQAGTQISKEENGQIAYSSVSNTSGKNANGEVFNTIHIPRAGQYQLTLPDGTKVWLNSSSTLKYPVSFVKNTRVVELDGEAYFEVATLYSTMDHKQKRPFIVKTSKQQIEVLGTHFNVNAYDNENVLKTTLIEGSVRVSPIGSGVGKILQPGQQALLTKEGNLRLASDIDTEEVIAWKDGMFYFNNTDLSVILRQLSRWYDVDIDIQAIPRKKFNGILPRSVKLSQVLQMMEKTSGLKFAIQERRIFMRI